METVMEKALYDNLVDSYDFSAEKALYLKSIYTELGSDLNSLYFAYSIIKNEKNLDCYCGDVMISPDGEQFNFSFKSESMFFWRKEIKEFLAHAITIFEGILPQGTVVELDVEKLKIPNPENTKVQVVISKRFLGEENGPFYQYGGELYPTGNYGTGKILSFTPRAIKKVVYKGYDSDVEKRFIYEMLDELIVKQHRLSMGFVENKEA